jgi:hypothetical protein
MLLPSLSQLCHPAVALCLFMFGWPAVAVSVSPLCHITLCFVFAAAAVTVSYTVRMLSIAYPEAKFMNIQFR